MTYVTLVCHVSSTCGPRVVHVRSTCDPRVGLINVIFIRTQGKYAEWSSKWRIAIDVCAVFVLIYDLITIPFFLAWQMPLEGVPVSP